MVRANTIFVDIDNILFVLTDRVGPTTRGLARWGWISQGRFADVLPRTYQMSSGDQTTDWVGCRSVSQSHDRSSYYPRLHHVIEFYGVVVAVCQSIGIEVEPLNTDFIPTLTSFPTFDHRLAHVASDNYEANEEQLSRTVFCLIQYRESPENWQVLLLM